jgi:uncharacterized oxidoreductase
MKLTGRTVLITGGTSGIGLGLAEAFLSSGSRVIVCGRERDKIKATAKKFPEITALQCDVGVAAQRKRLADEVLRRFPDLDVLVNNAGIQRYIDLKKGYEEIRAGGDEIAIDLASVVELTALFIGHLLKRPSAAIINVSSGLGFMPMISTPIYSAAKAAVHVYSLVLRKQLEASPVEVFEVVPPMVDTNLNKEGREKADLKFRGISVAEYVPVVMKGLENDDAMIFYGDGANVLSEPRGESEMRLLTPSWQA